MQRVRACRDAGMWATGVRQSWASKAERDRGRAQPDVWGRQAMQEGGRTGHRGVKRKEVHSCEVHT